MTATDIDPIPLVDAALRAADLSATDLGAVIEVNSRAGVKLRGVLQRIDAQLVAPSDFPGLAHNPTAQPAIELWFAGDVVVQVDPRARVTVAE
ncbi:hypothetical protein EDD28_0105 [Salana multivorans]|uniref:Uncharacterized protein n=1 Tax=Salana multivorans TaxID=120377 RepID=A0A3N2D7P8_9MICO|nr:hypothetical protein [Salana multivorans]ROR95464.1 hypothetical protein EDD28_0017 [Salana multivorans]ROR95548.1 hypothetical protein EDD28_0105 [Salana multivorans]